MTWNFVAVCRFCINCYLWTGTWCLCSAWCHIALLLYELLIFVFALFDFCDTKRFHNVSKEIFLFHCLVFD